MAGNLVEVAGIEPASKKPFTSESTCLVVFNLGSDGGDDQTHLAPAHSLRRSL